MEKYLKKHETYIRRVLESGAESYDWPGLARFHEIQIARMQHERLIHLLSTLAFGFFTLMSVLASMVITRIEIVALILLFLVLLVPYIAHYFKLENGVQRWYHLANQIERKAGRISEDYTAPDSNNRAF